MNLKEERIVKECKYEVFPECDYTEYDYYEGTCDCYMYDVLGQLYWEESKIMD